jgi:hypothetical protein
MERELVFRSDQFEAAKLVTRGTVLHTKNLVMFFLRVLKGYSTLEGYSDVLRT